MGKTIAERRGVANGDVERSRRLISDARYESVAQHARETLTIAGEGQGTISGTKLTSTCSTNLDSVVCKRGSVLANNGGLEQSAHANGNWCRDVNVCCCGKGGHEESEDVDSAIAKCSNIVARLDISERCADNVRNLLASEVSRATVARALAKAARAVETQTGAIVVDRSVIDDLIALVETRVASLCGKRGHLSQVCRSSSGNASVRAVEVEEREKPNTCGHCQFATFLDIPLDVLSVCDNIDLPSDESGNLLNMIMDSGAEEHAMSLADWKSLG